MTAPNATCPRCAELDEALLEARAELAEAQRKAEQESQRADSWRLFAEQLKQRLKGGD